MHANVILTRTTSTSSVFICMVFYAARNVYPSSFSGIKKRPNFHVARQFYHRAGVQVKPFSLKYKEFHRFRTDVSSAQTRFCFAAFRFRDVAPVQKVIRSPLCAGTTYLLLSSCALSTDRQAVKSSHNHRGYPPHCRSYIRWTALHTPYPPLPPQFQTCGVRSSG